MRRRRGYINKRRGIHASGKEWKKSKGHEPQIQNCGNAESTKSLLNAI